jgi:heme oxygenase (biliverdin-producing, ferredoxin)
MLSDKIRTSTHQLHKMAENSPFIRKFISGKVSQDVYKIYLAYLYFVYRALELTIDHNLDNEYIKIMYFPKLNRSQALESDLEYYFGPDWLDQIQQYRTPVQTYVDRIKFLGAHEPLLLIAHMYIRYAAELNGGPILKRVAIRTYNLQNDGINFYNFDFQTNQFKDTYRNALDSLILNPEQIDRISNEANVVFELNISLFQDLNQYTSSTKHNDHRYALKYISALLVVTVLCGTIYLTIF